MQPAFAPNDANRRKPLWRLYRHETSRRIDQLLAAYLFANKVLPYTSAMQVKSMLAQIDTDKRCVFHDGLQFSMNTVTVTQLLWRGGPLVVADQSTVLAQTA
jgi:hypothetical protein